jgi:hypothetical protein
MDLSLPPDRLGFSLQPITLLMITACCDKGSKLRVGDRITRHPVGVVQELVRVCLQPSDMTFLGAPLAERFDVPKRVVSGALQYAVGIITALVAITLMPPVIRNGPYILTVFAFFAAGPLYVLLEHYIKQAEADRCAAEGLTGREDISLACSSASWLTFSWMASLSALDQR